MSTNTSALTVGILIFDGVEVLDFAGPFEVFSVTRALGGTNDEAKLFTPVIIAEEQRIVHATGDLLIEPHYTITKHPPLDLVVIPGGQGTTQLQDHQPILDWIRGQSETVALTTSVCTGSLLLAHAGLLAGKAATTHWGSIKRMRDAFPDVTVEENVRFVDQGNVITSAGISAGIDMALSVVARLHGVETAWQTARTMEYDWRP